MNLNHVNLRVRDADACRSFYEAHFGFHLSFEADGGYFLRNEDGFVLALIPSSPHQPLPAGFHIGFGMASPDDVFATNANLAAAGVEVAEVSDFRPESQYVSFRLADPDETEVEVFWELA